MRPDSRSYIWSAAEAAADIIRIVQSISLDQFLVDKDCRRLVERYLEIVGEALRQLASAEPEMAGRITSLRGFVGLRNIIAHGYERVDYALIWAICRDDIPKLQAELSDLEQQ
jgi:uncharacterized protein with HEPN domain